MRAPERVSPDLWTLHWRLMDTPQRRENILGLFEDWLLEPSLDEVILLVRNFLGRVHRSSTPSRDRSVHPRFP